MNEYLVAEVTKNWAPGSPVADILSQRFEKIINVNHERGYKIIDWKFSQVINPEGSVLTETIVAIFQKIKTAS